MYFNNFEADLKAHLSALLEGPEREELLVANSIKPDIEDWTVTDVYGTHEEIGGSLASNKAALIDAFYSNSPATRAEQAVPGGITRQTPIEGASMAAKAPVLGRLTPDLIVFLKEINAKKEAAAAARNSTVTVEELGEVPTQPEDSEKR